MTDNLDSNLADDLSRELKRSFGPVSGSALGRATKPALTGSPVVSNTRTEIIAHLDAAERLAQRVVNLHDALLGYGPESTSDSSASKARSGSLGAVLDRGDEVAWRIAEANAALDALEKELGNG